jgi:hypothetical protein
MPWLRRLTVHHQCLLDPAGNGTLIFTGNVDANGVTPPPAGCVNITGFSEKKCNESAIIPVPKYPQFPPKRPRCRGGSWILKGAAPSAWLRIVRPALLFFTQVQVSGTPACN